MIGRTKRTARDVSTIVLGTFLTTAAKGLSPREAAMGAISTTSGIVFTRWFNRGVRERYNAGDPNYQLPLKSDTTFIK